MKDSEYVWVHAGTAIKYEGQVNPRALQKGIGKYSKCAIQSGRLLVAENEWVSLELIPKDTRKKRAETVWVYKGTGTEYPLHFEVHKLQQVQVNPKTRLIKYGILPLAGNKSVTLECITKRAQCARAEVWVYARTGIRDEKPFHVSELQQTEPNPVTGLLKYGTVRDTENEEIVLELISLYAKKMRMDGIWVYARTGIVFEGLVYEWLLEETEDNPNTNIVQYGTLRLAKDQTVRLERVSRKVQKTRAGVWVYAGTGIKYEGLVDFGQLRETKFNSETGLLESGVLYSTGNERIILEYVSLCAQLDRATKIWVQKDTGIEYEGPVDEDQLRDIKRNSKTQLIQSGTLDLPEGKEITLELICKSLQQHRLECVWVLKGTGKEYLEPVDEDQLRDIKRNSKTQLIQFGTLHLPEGKQITLEKIHRKLQRERAATVWVLKGKGTEYTGSVDERQLQQIKINSRNGLIKYCKLPVAENKSVDLELITKATQRHRVNTVWVIAGTHKIYEGTVDEQQLQGAQIDPCDGSIKGGILSPTITLERVTKSQQRSRAKKNKKNITIDGPVFGEHQEINRGLSRMSSITFFGNAPSPVDNPGTWAPLDASMDDLFEEMNFEL